MEQPVFGVGHSVLIIAEAGEGKFDKIVQGFLRIPMGDCEVKVVSVAKVVREVLVNQVNNITGDGVWLYSEWRRGGGLAAPFAPVVGIEVPAAAFGLVVRCH